MVIGRMKESDRKLTERQGESAHNLRAHKEPGIPLLVTYLKEHSVSKAADAVADNIAIHSCIQL